MSNWPVTKARRVLAALQRIGWVIKRQSGSHRTLSRPDRPDFVFTEAPDSVFSHYRRQVAQLMAGVYLDVIKPLVQPYPDLDPGRDEEP